MAGFLPIFHFPVFRLSAFIILQHTISFLLYIFMHLHTFHPNPKSNSLTLLFLVMSNSANNIQPPSALALTHTRNLNPSSPISTTFTGHPLRPLAPSRPSSPSHLRQPRPRPLSRSLQGERDAAFVGDARYMLDEDERFSR